MINDGPDVVASVLKRIPAEGVDAYAAADKFLADGVDCYVRRWHLGDVGRNPPALTQHPTSCVALVDR